MASTAELSEPERQALADLRKRFQSEYEATASWTGKIAQSDIVRLKSQDWWPLKFLQRYDLDVDIAFPVFIECLKWRNEFSRYGLLIPKEELSLRTVVGESDRVEVVVVRNTGAKNVMFKIKTTSPEKFRVRPSSGIIHAGDTAVVRLYLQPGYQETIGREKFLVMALETDESTADNFAALWKDATEKNKSHFEHRLRCRVGDLIATNASPIANGSAHKQLSGAPFSHQMEELAEQVRNVRNENRILLLLLVLVLVMMFALLLYQRSAYYSLTHLYEDAISSHTLLQNNSTSRAEL
uniref:Major sperm protein n=1 Tax=Plectus sambesii TaxID=2011161 RepID=A0A914WAY5_9BILA